MTLHRLAPVEYSELNEHSDLVQAWHNELRVGEDKNIYSVFEGNGIYSRLPLSEQDGDQRRSLEIKDFSKLEKGLLELDKPNQKSTSKNQS